MLKDGKGSVRGCGHGHTWDQRRRRRRRRAGGRVVRQRADTQETGLPMAGEVAHMREEEARGVQSMQGRPLVGSLGMAGA